ncbi:MAG: tetratricopeptide repeat protein [Anaerolineaceae bacterium]|nr:tetratricopeptide repeat protein [Anaerolineaceae bacterium]
MDYFELDQQCETLFDNNHFDEALILMEKAEKQFPEMEYIILFNLAILHTAKNNYQKSLAYLDKATRKQYFFDLNWDLFSPLKQFQEFKVIIERNQRNKKEAQKSSRMKYRVFRPENFQEDQPHPLFLALHGNGYDLDTFIRNWPPE